MFKRKNENEVIRSAREYRRFLAEDFLTERVKVRVGDKDVWVSRAAIEDALREVAESDSERRKALGLD